MTTHIITRNENGNAELDGELLIYHYPEGDVDTINFDRPNMEHLKAALFDERECSSEISYSDDFSINGVVFTID